MDVRNVRATGRKVIGREHLLAGKLMLPPSLVLMMIAKVRSLTAASSPEDRLSVCCSFLGGSCEEGRVLVD